MRHVLEADGIQLAFGLRRILNDVYLRCQTGAITGLLGRNGQGKTCLMNTVFGTLENADKSIRFDGRRIVHPFKRPELIRYLPQFNFIPAGISLQRVFVDFNVNFETFKHDFPNSNLRITQKVRDLSGGQKRLLEIYTILKSPCQFVMLDEPFTHLAPRDVERIKEIIISEKENKGILLSDHLYQHIIEISEAIYVLVNGKTWRINNNADIEDLGYAKRL